MAASHHVCSVCGINKPVEQFPKKRFKTCKDCRTIRFQRYCEDGPDAFLRRRFSVLKSRAKKGQMACDITVDDLRDLARQQNMNCALTGLPMQAKLQDDMSMSVDRIDPQKGYIKDNVRFVCARANLIRGDMHDHDMLWWCRAMVNHLGD